LWVAFVDLIEKNFNFHITDFYFLQYALVFILAARILKDTQDEIFRLHGFLGNIPDGIFYGFIFKWICWLLAYTACHRAHQPQISLQNDWL